MPTILSLRLCAYIWVTALCTCTLGAPTCFYPEGNQAPNDTPCSTSGEHSPCCGPDAFCLDNGLCFANGSTSRGSCTDPNWGDACSSFCGRNADGCNDTYGCLVLPCDGERFTCGYSSNCASDINIFTMTTDVNIVMRATQVAAIQTSLHELTIAPTMTFTAVADALSSSSSGTSSTSATTSTPSPSSAASSSASSSSRSGAKFTAAQLAGTGVGVGVPLLLALISALFVIHRQNKRLSGLAAPGFVGHLENRRYETPDLLSTHSSLPAAPRQSMPFSEYASDMPKHGQPHYQPVPQGGRFVEQMKEMDTSQQRVEMDSEGRVHELSTRQF